MTRPLSYQFLMKKQYRLVFHEEYIITCQHIYSSKQVSGFTKAAEDPLRG